MEQFVNFKSRLINMYPLVLSEKNFQYKMLKRILDIIVSGLGLVILLPIFMGIAICIKCESPDEKVFFFQKRIGYNGKIFKIIKFRSMKSSTPENMATRDVICPEKYMSCVGKVLRKSSLDELPQLWNVLKGDMSLIGPRPLIVTEEDIHILRKYYGIYQILPGITGLAQVNGRDTLDIYTKVSLDWKYLKDFSLAQDIKIIGRTIKVVLKNVCYQEGTINKYTKEEINDTCIHCWE